MLTIKNCTNCANKERCSKTDVARNMPCIDYKERKICGNLKYTKQKK